MTNTQDRSGLFALGRVLVCDGAMGTVLHSAGTPLGRSISELNLTRPRLVHDLHAAYVSAGADILQTNTFDASRLRLADAGRADDVAAVNIAGARLAREAAQAAGRPVLVAGSVGPARGATLAPRVPPAERAAILGEQVAALADWVDVLLLETFAEIASLTQAVEVALTQARVPVIAQMTFGDDGRTLRGEEPAAVAAALRGYPLAALGANCTVGPAVLQDVVAELAAETDAPLVVQPNAGTPRWIGRSLRYAHNTAYFADAAVEFVARGARIVGGCCGTSPGHIRAVAAAVAAAPVAAPVPSRARATAARGPQPVTPAGPGDGDVGWPRHGRPVVLAGMGTPRGAEVPGYLEAARSLVAAGADLLAVVEPEPPTARVNPVAAGVLLSERTGAGVVVQIEAAGRSLAALQADLLGAHAFGLRHVVCRTGMPRVAGDYPDPGSATDVDSLRLVSVLAGLNEGVDWRGVPMPERTRFVIGASVRLGALDQGRETERAAAKIRAGAHFLLSDVVHDEAQAQRAVHAVRALDVTVPLIVSLAPFQDARAIARMTHELADVVVPETALDAGRDGLAEAAVMAEKLLPGVDGLLVLGPGVPSARLVGVVGRLSALCRAT